LAGWGRPGYSSRAANGIQEMTNLIQEMAELRAALSSTAVYKASYCALA
jgi:hypothetical protein